MDELSLDQLADAIEQVADSTSDNFIEMSRMLGLDPLTDFAGADLSGADLSFANLSEADLSFANLSGANLSEAYLSRADLSFANLSEAYLREVCLSGARIDKTIFGSNIGLSEQQEDDLKELGAVFIDAPGSGDRVAISPRVPSRR